MLDVGSGNSCGKKEVKDITVLAEEIGIFFLLRSRIGRKMFNQNIATDDTFC